MKKFVITLLVMIFIITLPVNALLIYGNFMQENKYSESFYAGMKIKYDRLKETEGERIIIIGGSAVAFGLRTDELESATGKTVVNFGLYARLGIKAMTELAKPYIKEGDIIIIIPELSSETYSDNIDYNILLKCLENIDKSIYLKTFGFEDKTNLFTNYFSFVFERAKGDVNPIAPYNIESFNEYGDIESDEVKINILPSFYDESQLIVPDKTWINKEFKDYINSFVKYAEKKNAKVYFSFSPSNVRALYTEKTEEFEKVLSDSLDCEVLGNVKDFMYNSDCFYDTNYHMNYSGSFAYTKTLADLIKEKENILCDYEIKVPDPPTPKYQTDFGTLSDDCYILKENDFGLIITGIKEEIKEQLVNLTIPNKIDGKSVIGIDTKALANCVNLKMVVIPGTVTYIAGNVFENCPNLISIMICAEEPPLVSSNLLDGANEDVLIYIPKKYVKNYKTGYAWVTYLSKIREFEVQQ